MRLPVDDEIYNVNAVWLGPPNKTLPFRARYVAYARRAVVFVLLQMVERRLGIGLGFFILAYSLWHRRADPTDPQRRRRRPTAGLGRAVRPRGRRAARATPAHGGPHPPGSGACRPHTPGPGPNRKAARLQPKHVNARGGRRHEQARHRAAPDQRPLHSDRRRIMAWYLLIRRAGRSGRTAVREQLDRRRCGCVRPAVKRSCTSGHDPALPGQQVGRRARRERAGPLPGWRNHLLTDQQHLSGRSMADKEVYVGVEIPARKGSVQGARLGWPARSDREVAALSKESPASTDEIMASPGMDGAPATPAELEWLLHRSCSLGLPAPLTLGVRRRRRGRKRTCRVHRPCAAGSRSRTAAPSGSSGSTTTSGSNGTSASSRVGRMTDLEIPSGIPWMQRTDQLGFPVEWSARGHEVEDSAKVGRRCAATSRRSAPRRTTTRSSTTNPPRARWTVRPTRPWASRTRSRWACPGCRPAPRGLVPHRRSPAAIEEEALERASLCASSSRPQVTIARPADQYAVAREFIPGERLASTAYRRRMPVTTLRRRRPRGDREGGRPGRHPPGRDVRHRRPRGDVGAVGDDRARRGVRPRGAVRRSRRWQVDGRREHHLPLPDAGRAVDGARPLRPTDRAVPDAGTGRARPGPSTCSTRPPACSTPTG